MQTELLKDVETQMLEEENYGGESWIGSVWMKTEVGALLCQTDSWYDECEIENFVFLDVI